MDVNTCISFLEGYQLDYFSLRHLLSYVDFMDKASFTNFSDALKCKVLDKIGEFDTAQREELDVLCQLLNESLTENGQKIITKRILTIVNRTLLVKGGEKESKCDCILIDDNPQHNIKPEKRILEPFLNCRIPGKIDGQQEKKSIPINKSSTKVYKSQKKHVSLQNSNGGGQNIKKEITNSIESYNSSFSTNDSISVGENGNIKKEIIDSTESYDSSSSTYDSISVDGDIKKEIPDSIQGHDLGFSTNNYSNAGEIKYEMFYSIGDHDASFHSKGCINTGEKENSCITNYAASNMHLSCTLIGSKIKKHIKSKTRAREFVNKNKKVDVNLSYEEGSTFGHFCLNDLLNYDVELMPRNELEDYSNALKLRISDKISSFLLSDKEELKELCTLLNSNPTDSDKKIICSRMCALVDRTISNKQCNRKINCRIPRYQQQAYYGS